MRALKLLILMFFSFIASIALAASSDGIAWQSYSTASFTKAKNQHMLVLVYAQTEWCHWCQQMKQTTYGDPRVISFINKNFIPIKIDIDKNPDIAKQLKVIKFPTTLIMDENRRIINQIDGYASPDEFMNSLNQVVPEKQSLLNSPQNPSTMDITIVGKKKIL